VPAAKLGCIGPIAELLTRLRQRQLRFWAKNDGAVRDRGEEKQKSCGKLGNLCRL